MFWRIVLYIVFVVAGYFLGSFAWSQIVGTFVVNNTARNMKEDEYGPLLPMIAMRKAKTFYVGLAIWSLIIIAAVVLCLIFVSNYIWGLAAGLVISLLAVLKSVQSLRQEFISGLLS